MKIQSVIYIQLNSGSAIFRVIANCPTNSDITDNTCFWDISTTPMYRQPYEYYFFTLYGENALGNISTTFRFHHYANGKV